MATAIFSGITLVVLAITMWGVLKYAGEAKTQSGSLNNSVIQQTNNVEEQIADSRPVVLANGIQPTKKVPDAKTGKEKIAISDVPTDTAQVTVLNFGKTVTVNMVPFGILAFGQAEHDAPIDPRCSPNSEPLPDTPKSPLAPVPYSSYGLQIKFQEGESLASRREGDNLFAVGCIYYEALDGKRYYTDVCTMWRDGSFQACWSPHRNYLCERSKCDANQHN